MRATFKILSHLAASIRKDLSRPHPYAAERVGFIACRIGRGGGVTLLMAEEYYAVDDGDYVDDPTVGAMMGSEAIRKALERAYGTNLGMFHVHMHGHEGRPGFSRTDITETGRFVPDFFHVRPE